MAKGKGWGEENLMTDRQMEREAGGVCSGRCQAETQADEHKLGRGGSQTDTVQHSSADTSRRGSMQQDSRTSRQRQGTDSTARSSDQPNCP